MIVKKTCKNKLTAFINTAKRYSHASPDIMTGESREDTLSADNFAVQRLSSHAISQKLLVDSNRARLLEWKFCAAFVRAGLLAAL